MPKEMFYDQAPVSPDGSEHPLPALRIGWDKEADTFVYVATVDQRVNEVDEAYGWFVRLNRYQINDLIRVLRRARDQVFGGDE